MDELRIYLRMLLRSWWIVVLCTLAALLLALIATYLETPMYRATALFLVTPSEQIVETVDLARALTEISRPELIATYVEIFQSDQIYNMTVRQLGLNPSNLRGYNRTATALPQTSVIQLTVVGSDAQTVALLANAIGAQGMAFTDPLYLMFDSAQLDMASPPGSPFSPVPTRTASIAAILGLAVGVALAIIYEQLRIPVSAPVEGQTESEFPENSPWSRWSRKR